MAFVLKFTSPFEVFTLDNMSPSTTLKGLKMQLEEMTDIPCDKMKILHGYPPKALCAADETSLGELGIKSGDSLKIDFLLGNPQAAVVETAKSTTQEKKVEQNVPKQETTGFGSMVRKVVKANNSCLFSSLHFLILDKKNVDYVECEMLREICAKAVASNPTKYSEAYLGKPNNEYCEWIRNGNNWGGGIELEILSEHFDVEIVVINVKNELPMKFGEGKNYNNRVFLLYDGIHYDPLILQLGDACQTIFLTSDSDYFDMAVGVGSEARRKREFIDVTSDSFQCNICQETFAGEAELAVHAKLTGHAEFKQI